MKNSINPKIWGSSGWIFIHYTALGYPDNPTDEDKKNYKSFFYNLGNTLPCLKCANNFKKNINELPIDNSLNSRNDLFKWTVNIHNMVNNELGKNNLSFEEALNKYKNTRPSIYDFKNICMCITIILLVLIIIYLFNK